MDHQLDVLWAAKYDYHVGWGIKKHQHDYYQIIYVTSGVGNFILQDLEFRVEKDEYLFIKPFEFHELKKMEKTELKVLEIKFRVHGKVWTDRLKHVFGLYHCEETTLKNMMEKIREEGKAKQYYYKETIHNYLSLILYAVLRNSQCGTEQKDSRENDVTKDFSGLAKIVASYLGRHYMDDIKLETLAGTLGYNKNYLCQAFKEGSGYTVNDYLYYIRIMKAKDLIAYSDYDLKHISNLVGFQDVHHFNRVFKKTYGTPPGQYRKREMEEMGVDVIIDEKFVNPSQIDDT